MTKENSGELYHGNYKKLLSAVKKQGNGIITEEFEKVRDAYIERFGIKRYLQKVEVGISDEDFTLELLKTFEKESHDIEIEKE